MTTEREKADRRYRLRLSSLKFLSLVDHPAQETAQVLLTKRAGDAELGISGTAQVVKVSDELGLVFAWAWTGKKDGEDYYDLHGDAIVDDDEMVKVAADFMAGSRAQDVQHDRDPDGMVVFAMPMTPDIAKAFGVETKTTGLMVAVKPSAEVFAQVKAGELRGISLDGTGIREAAKSKPTPARTVKNGVLTTETDGHSHIVDDGCQSGTTSYGYGADGAGHSHPYVIAGGVITIGAAMGHTHEPMTASKRAPSPAPKAATQENKTMDPIPLRKALSEMTPGQLAHYQSLPTDEAKDAFLAKSGAERDAIVKAATEADPPVYTTADGTVIRKSQDPTGLLVKALKDADEAKKSANIEKAAREQLELEKRAHPLTEFLPGTLQERAAMVKAIESLPEAQRANAFAMLKAGNDAAAQAFEDRGTGPGGGHDETSAKARLEKRVAEHAGKRGISKSKALVELTAPTGPYADQEARALYEEAADEAN